ELERPHAGPLCGREVPQLVDEDQAEQAQDRDDVVHFAGAPSRSCAISRARASAASTCSTDVSGSGFHRSSTDGTVSAIARKPHPPARNAATATSLAAFRAQGAVPPATPAARASARQRNASVSGGSKSSEKGCERSSRAAPVAGRSGYVSA